MRNRYSAGFLHAEKSGHACINRTKDDRAVRTRPMLGSRSFSSGSGVKNLIDHSRFLIVVVHPDRKHVRAGVMNKHR